MTPPPDPPLRPEDDWGDFEAWAEEPPGGPTTGSAAGSRRGPFGDHRAPQGLGEVLGAIEDDPRVKAGVEHLQRAAHEVIAASRALLDVAEELVDAPGGVTNVFAMLGELGDVAQRVARSRSATGGTDDGADPDPPVQRIPVS